MKASCTIFFFLINLPGISFSQFDNLVDFEKQTLSRFKTGMSQDEVKRVLGKPKTIKPGFPVLIGDPESDFTSDPELDYHGFTENLIRQTDKYITWFYFYHQMSVKIQEPEKTVYRVNGFEVNEELFDDYRTAEHVFIYSGEVIYPAMGRSYHALKDNRLSIVPKETTSTFSQRLKGEITTEHFVPVLCVILDKRTQTVAAIKMFFKQHQE